MSERDEMSLQEILTTYQDGDGIGWPAALAWVRTYHATKIAELTIDVANRGFQEPISLGTDGRVWDGHHRLAVAEALGWKHLPILHAEDEEAER
jgi:ParB-like chromosome segregation protein Spo0J